MLANSFFFLAPLRPVRVQVKPLIFPQPLGFIYRLGLECLQGNGVLVISCTDSRRQDTQGVIAAAVSGSMFAYYLSPYIHWEDKPFDEDKHIASIRLDSNQTSRLQDLRLRVRSHAYVIRFNVGGACVEAGDDWLTRALGQHCRAWH